MEAYLRRGKGNRLSVLIAGTVVSPQDVYDAARVALGPIQRGSYMPWRNNEAHWYSDDRLREDIKQQRFDAMYRPDDMSLMRARPSDVFTMPTALEILLVGVSMETRAVVSSLDQLGVRWDTSPIEDYAFAFDLFDRPEVFDPIRETGLPLSAARQVLDAVGSDLLRLMWQAGLTGTEIVHAVTSGELPNPNTLRVLAALRSPTRV